jgi:hypothetical protein
MDITTTPVNTKLAKLIQRVVPEPMSEKEFGKLSRSQKAIMIAQDALALLKNKLVSASTGQYVNLDKVISGNDYDISATSLEAKCGIFSKGRCTVCAKGALFVSTIMRTNQMSVGDLVNGDTESKVCDTEEIFDRRNFSLIETAFELHYSHELDEVENTDIDSDIIDAHLLGKELDPCGYPILALTRTEKRHYQLCKDALAFGDKFLDETERLAAILINIIRNKGTFVPSKSVKPSDVKRALHGRGKK